MNKRLELASQFSIKYSIYLCLLYSLFIPIIIVAPLIIANKFGFPLAQIIGIHKKNIYLLLIFIDAAAAVVLSLLISRQLKLSKNTWSSLGLRKFKFWQSLKYIFGWPFLILGCLALVAGISALLGYQPPAKSMQDSTALKYQVLPAFIGVSLFAPLLEEILYRGILFPSIARKYGLSLGIILSSVIFAISHINPLQMVTAIILGPYLCIMYKRLNSLIPGMILHSIHNAAVTAITIASLSR